MITMMTPLGGGGVWDLNDDMITQHSKVNIESKTLYGVATECPGTECPETQCPETECPGD